MNRDDVVRLALSVGFLGPDEGGSKDGLWEPTGNENVTDLLHSFAQAIEQHLISSGYRKCAEGQHTSQFCGQLEQAVRDEREACAKVCDAEAQVLPYPIGSKSAEICAELIRSRMFPNTTIHALA